MWISEIYTVAVLNSMDNWEVVNFSFRLKTFMFSSLVHNFVHISLFMSLVCPS